MSSRNHTTKAAAQSPAMSLYCHRWNLVKHSKASWLIRRYSVSEACDKAGIL
jgi:hypothetical protein